MADDGIQDDGTKAAEEPGGSAAPSGSAAAEAAEEASVPIEEEETPAADVRVSALEAEVTSLRTQVSQGKDRYLRLAADFDNARKRAAKQEIEVRERARADTMRDVLPVIDNVERALGFAQEIPAAGTIAEGLRLVIKSFFDAFASQKLERFESLGRAFDPARHEAVGQLETTESPAGTIVQELQAGYVLGEKLLRPAMVLVARAPRPAPAPEAEGAGGTADAGAAGGEPPGGDAAGSAAGGPGDGGAPAGATGTEGDGT